MLRQGDPQLDADVVALARDVLGRERVLDALCRLRPDADPFDGARWRRLAEVGLTGLLLGADRGGIGGSLRLAAAVAEEVGRAMLPEPFAATNAAILLLIDGGPSELAQRVLAGEAAVGWLLQPTSSSVEGDRVLAVASGRPDAYVGFIEPEVVVVTSHSGAPRTVDGTDPSRRIVEVTERGASRRPAGRDAVHHVFEVLTAAEAVGSMAAAVERTVAYVREREQFGRPVGSFQAVKHRCADMWAQTELARAAVMTAATSTDEEASTAGRDVAVAAIFVADAFVQVAADAVHLHGGMGYAWESGCHLFVRRSLATRRLLGDLRAHKQVVLSAVTDDQGAAP